MLNCPFDGFYMNKICPFNNSYLKYIWSDRFECYQCHYSIDFSSDETKLVHFQRIELSANSNYIACITYSYNVSKIQISFAFWDSSSSPSSPIKKLTLFCN